MLTNIVVSPTFNSKVESAAIIKSIGRFDGDARIARYNAIYTISPPTQPVNTHRSLCYWYQIDIFECAAYLLIKMDRILF